MFLKNRRTSGEGGGFSQEPVAEGEHVVDAILARRFDIFSNTLQYKVKWLDGTYSWKPEHWRMAESWYVVMSEAEAASWAGSSMFPT